MSEPSTQPTDDDASRDRAARVRAMLRRWRDEPLDESEPTWEPADVEPLALRQPDADDGG